MRYALLPLIALFLATTGACAESLTPRTEPTRVMQRFIIEREVPGAASMTPEQLREGASKSNAVLHELGPDIQWVQSYVAGDKVYCVYYAPSEALIRLHAQRAGFPANKVTPVAAVIDPTTARP